MKQTKQKMIIKSAAGFGSGNWQMIRTFFFLFFCMPLMVLIAQVPATTIQITAKSSTGRTTMLFAGIDVNATDGIDAALGEAVLSGTIPSGSFDIRWKLPGGEGSLSDYRQGETDLAGNRVHWLQITPDSSTQVQLQFILPAGVTFRLQDSSSSTHLDTVLAVSDTLFIISEVL